MSGRTVEIAEHLWTVLETMARDMATEPRALVNQAVFNWARRNGYPVSAAAVEAKAPAAAPGKETPPPAAAAPSAVSAPSVPRPEVVLVEEPVPEAKPVAKVAAEPVPVAVPAPAPPAAAAASQAARIAAIDADVDRYCLVPVVVDAEFEAESANDEDASEEQAGGDSWEEDDDQAQGDDEDDDESAEVAVASAREPSAPSAPAVDVAALRVAAAARIVVIDRAVDEVLPRPQAAASVPIPVPVAAPAAPAPAPAPARAAPAAPAPAPAPAPAAAAATPAAAAAAASAHSRPTLTIAPATLAAQSPATAPAPAPKAEAAPALAGAKGRQRMDTSELNNLLGEVDDILGQNVVRDTALSPAIPFVLELRVRGTDQVCTVASDPVVIGRGPHCDLVVQSAEASREHAVVSRNGASYVIEDRGSSNGTWFGNEQVRSREIHSGDVFRIGSVDVVASFKIGGAQAKAG